MPFYEIEKRKWIVLVYKFILYAVVQWYNEKELVICFSLTDTYSNKCLKQTTTTTTTTTKITKKKKKQKNKNKKNQKKKKKKKKKNIK